MGRVHVNPPKVRRVPRPRLRVKAPRPAVEASRFLFVLLLAAALVYVPVDWVRLAAGAVVFLIAYRAGYRDGKRDTLFSLLRPDAAGHRGDAGES